MDAKEEVRARLPIEDVIGEYVQLKRSGRHFKGLSPFTAEKTPSFIVSPDKQIWHCFSSGRGGDVFKFIQEIEGVDFKTSLEILARRAGVDLSQFQGQGKSNSKQKERLFDALELATKFYQMQLKHNNEALDYILKKRRYSKATTLQWRFGYSPNSGRALVDFLTKRGFTEAEIKQAGLTSQSYRGQLQDMFRGRIMIPLADGQGRVVGFTARLLADDPKAPKYINTPATLLYDKSRHVFGLHHAKQAIRKSGYAVLVEGNLDVVASHQAGVAQTIATAGTALTDMQLKALRQLTDDVRLCFDADAAGLSATERAIPIASKVGVSLGIISIPSGKDPDELIKQSVSSWQKIVEQPVYALDWLIARYKELLNLDTAPGKREFTDVVLAVVRSLSDPVEQEHYLHKLAEMLEVSPEALRSKLSTLSTSAAKQKRRPKPNNQLEKSPKMTDKQRSEERLLALTLMHPKLRFNLENLSLDMLTNPSAQAVFEFLAANPDFDGTDKAAVQKLDDYGKILSVVYEAMYQGLDALELANEAARLKTHIVRSYVKTQKLALSSAMRDASATETETLLQKARELDDILRLNEPKEIRYDNEA